MTDTPTLTTEDLASAVETALWNYAPVRGSLSELEIQMSADGRVEVSGPVRTRLIKDGVLESLRWVPGVTAVVDRLVADSELEVEVAIALAADPRLKALPPGAVKVHSHLGEVTLLGRLQNQSERAAAAEIARGISGVLAVHDRTTGG